MYFCGCCEKKTLERNGGSLHKICQCFSTCLKLSAQFSEDFGLFQHFHWCLVAEDGFSPSVFGLNIGCNQIIDIREMMEIKNNRIDRNYFNLIRLQLSFCCSCKWTALIQCFSILIMYSKRFIIWITFIHIHRQQWVAAAMQGAAKLTGGKGSVSCPRTL